MEEIKKIVRGFTRGMLGRKSTTSKCFVVCLPLQSYLRFCGYDCYLTEGELEFDNGIHHHFWITLADGNIIDPTADQFNKYAGSDKQLPKNYVGKKPSWYNIIEQ